MKNIKKIFSFIQEYIFPIFCLQCKKEGSWLCDNCFITLEIDGYFACPVCGVQNRDGIVCCKKIFLSQHIAIATYKHKTIIEQIIHLIKYQYLDSLKKVITKICIHFYISQHVLFNDIDIITAIPLYKKREAERGFNQAQLICDSLSIVTAIPTMHTLKRCKKTKQQALLSLTERKKNLQGAFALIEDVQGKTVLLVDDVFTTGSTLEHAAEVLIMGGAKQVIGFSLARGKMRNEGK